ncbi:hypothetical protein INT43_000483 [Umbelopsis isabellina]|uniref:Thioredoxin-dependent peroxiredoxin n=1 Tax=Mortierella isabellina TaxID=91625 RepID=A0A8H7Q1A1_MORIS|nr:hypothetical protein INT43_000483 [Umbelopsis isabellina]
MLSRTFLTQAKRSFHSSRVASIKVGDRIPDVEVQGSSPAETHKTGELLASKKRAILFGVPGAFTPGCTKDHLPGYIKKADELKAKGVDFIGCVAVNDAFVMTAWGKSVGNEGEVTLLADPAGELAKALDLNFDATGVLGNHRYKRFAAVVEGGVVKQLFVEPDNTGLNVSLAENVIKQL